MKRQLPFFAFLVSCAATLALSTAPASPPGMDLWPMHVGSTWEYKTDGTLGPMNSVLTVKSTSVENGTTLVKMTNKPEGKDASMETYRLTNQGIMQLSAGKNELPIVKYPLTAGAKWNWSGTEAQIGKRVKATMSFA